MTTSHDPPLGAARRLEGFDGLRAVAVFAVMAYHFFQRVDVLRNSRVWDIGQQLRVGVWIFFVLSGFLLYRPYARATAGAGAHPSLARYARARFLRIWPAYAVALLILAFLWHKVELDDARSVLVHLALLSNYVPEEFTNALSPARSLGVWSLGVEISFYAFLPLYAWAIARAARGRRALRVEVAGLCGLAIVGIIWQFSTVHHTVLATALPSFIPTFAIGMALAVGVVHGRSVGLPALASRPWLCWVGAAVLLIGKGLIGGFDGFAPGFRFENQLVYAAIAGLVVLPAVYGNRDALTNRALRSRPAHLLGMISYGMFLWSIPVIDTVQFEWISPEPRWGRSALVAIVSLAVIIVIATVSWLVVERPALRLKRPTTPDDRSVPPADAPTRG